VQYCKSILLQAILSTGYKHFSYYFNLLLVNSDTAAQTAIIMTAINDVNAELANGCNANAIRVRTNEADYIEFINTNNG